MEIYKLFKKLKIDNEFYEILVKSVSFEEHVNVWKEIIESNEFKNIDKDEIRLIRNRLRKGIYKDITPPYDIVKINGLEAAIDPFLISILKCNRNVEILLHLIEELDKHGVLSFAGLMEKNIYKGVLMKMDVYDISLTIIDKFIYLAQWNDLLKEITSRNKLFVFQLYRKYFWDIFDVELLNNADSKYFWDFIKFGGHVPLPTIIEIFENETTNFVLEWEKWGEIIYDYYSYKNKVVEKDFFDRNDFITTDLLEYQKDYLTSYLDDICEDEDFVLRIRMKLK